MLFNYRLFRYCSILGFIGTCLFVFSFNFFIRWPIFLFSRIVGKHTHISHAHTPTTRTIIYRSYRYFFYCEDRVMDSILTIKKYQAIGLEAQEANSLGFARAVPSKMVSIFYKIICILDRTYSLSR